MRISRTAIQLLALLGVLLGGEGCGVVAISPQSQVEKTIKAHSQAVNVGNWKLAATFYHKNFRWKTRATSVKGKGAVKGVLLSIKDIRGLDEFYTQTLSVKKLSDTKVAATVSFQAHLITSSMQMEFSNRSWRAKMLWVRVAPQTWRIGIIEEVTPRRRM